MKRTAPAPWPVHWRTPPNIHISTSYNQVSTGGFWMTLCFVTIQQLGANTNSRSTHLTSSLWEHQFLFSLISKSTHPIKSLHQSHLDQNLITTYSQTPSYLQSKCFSSPVYQSRNLNACKLDQSPDVWCMLNHSLINWNYSPFHWTCATSLETTFNHSRLTMKISS